MASAEDTSSPAGTYPDCGPEYTAAFRDWLACAIAGANTATARSAAQLGSSLDDRLIAAGTAGHVLDFDDTYAPGLSHVSATIGPVVLLLGADVGATLADGLAAFGRAFEASAAFSRANHPTLRERGWHPTSVCGTVGAAIAAAALLQLSAEQEQQAIRLGLLRASGLGAAFGSGGKALQVGFSAAAGACAARLARSGARASATILDGVSGFPDAYGGRVVLRGDGPAIRENWIKAYPCCLQTHAAIEAALAAAEQGAGLRGATVRVHPVSLKAAALSDVDDGLQAKFSIPYLAAYAFIHGAPGCASFDSVDKSARALAASVIVVADGSLLESEAVLTTTDGSQIRVRAALGSPARPMTPAQLEAKVTSLAGECLDGAFIDPTSEIEDLLRVSGIAPRADHA